MYLADRVACIAGKPGYHRKCIPIWGRRGSNVGAGAMTNEFAGNLPDEHRCLAVAIQQMIELGLFLVEAVQDRVDRVS